MKRATTHFMTMNSSGGSRVTPLAGPAPPSKVATCAKCGGWKRSEASAPKPKPKPPRTKPRRSAESYVVDLTEHVANAANDGGPPVPTTRHGIEDISDMIAAESRR